MSQIDPAGKEQKGIDLNALRQKLNGVFGKKFWRSLDEVQNTKEFQQQLEREFPEGLTEWTDPVSRRQFLKLMGASLMFAGLAGCSGQPLEKIVPYVKSPEEIVPGKPLWFATAFPFQGFARGIMAETHMGRPTKIEGNPRHPQSLGATDLFTQASILTLYDPDRAKNLRREGRISTWEKFIQELNEYLLPQQSLGGKGIRILTETVTSPTLYAQIQQIRKLFPELKWHQYEPVNRDSVKQGARIAFGRVAETHYDFTAADVVAVFDSDIFLELPSSIKYTKDFMSRRRIYEQGTRLNRLYAIESTPTLTGGVADHRLSLSAQRVEAAVWFLADVLGVRRTSASLDILDSYSQEWLRKVSADLIKSKGRTAVVVGPTQPAGVHALAHAINDYLGNVGKTVFYSESAEFEPAIQTESLLNLVDDIKADRVDMLFILGGNPVYSAPSDVPFAEMLNRVPFRVHQSLFQNETSAKSNWHIPLTHYMEAWSDLRSFDGRVTIVQPLIEPLYAGKSFHEVLSVLTGVPKTDYSIVREYWQNEHPTDFERFWKTSLHRGFMEGTEFSFERLAPSIQSLQIPNFRPEAFEVNFRPDPTIWDGSYINNGWLQEIPKPMTKLTWDNAVLISPKTAETLGVANENLVELDFNGKKLKAPIFIVPGHAHQSATLHLGYGQQKSGRVGAGTGFNFYLFRTSNSMWRQNNVSIIKASGRYPLSTTQNHYHMEGRDLVRFGPLALYLQNPDFAHKGSHHAGGAESLYPEFEYNGNAWGMAVDLNTCTGCNACVVACQAENNIPIVGKKEVAMGREMHWIRIDRYYGGGLDNPDLHHQPVMCMHCEKAPCEPVCPVGATVHSSEGLNEMVYNRCVGTRYCSNNCPYKVRRFNFFQYVDTKTESLKAQRNPDVTVRMRGVMEKCTYCVQRINHARIEAKKEGREIRDGEVQTACQQVCPADAIIFGNINDPESKVHKLKKQKLNYGLLTELNTQPRTSYLAKVKNTNELIEKR